jgi:hypothetical protein
VGLLQHRYNKGGTNWQTLLPKVGRELGLVEEIKVYLNLLNGIKPLIL